MLEERGEDSAADALRGGELATALAALRAEALEPPEAVQLCFDYILVEERERVANAAVLAELLAPMLGTRAPAGIAAPAVHATPMPAADTPTTPPERPRPVNIADFIDEMLAQERAEPPGHRRAS